MSVSRITRMVFAGTLALLASSSVNGCSLIVEDKLGKGIGASCSSSSDCQGSSCVNGLCSLACTAGGNECPEGTTCSAGQCQRPLNIGAIFIGNSGEGWTKTHGDSLKEVSASLGFPKVTVTENVVPGDATKALVEQYIQSGNKVILATSTSYAADVTPLAEKYPDVKFLVCEGSTITENLGSYYGRREQAWYLAGQVAAAKSSTKRLGIVGSFVSPDTIRNINAFTLGAQKVSPEIKVEVRWSGFWFDYNSTPSFSDNPEQTHADPGFTPINACRAGATKSTCWLEEYLTKLLLEGGADVVTHQSDVARSISFVETVKTLPDSTPAFSIANNNRYGCKSTGNSDGTDIPTCVLSVYWNWTPLYTELFTDMQFNRWKPANIYESIQADTSRSIVGVELSSVGRTAVDEPSFNAEVSRIANSTDPYLIFKGPYETNDRNNGEPDSVPAGQTLTEDEAFKMCWYVKGIVEKSDPFDPSSADVDAKVPNGDTRPWMPDPNDTSKAALALPPFGESTPNAFSCKAHGGG